MHKSTRNNPWKASTHVLVKYRPPLEISKQEAKEKRDDLSGRTSGSGSHGTSWKEKEAKKKRIIRSEAKEVKGELGRNLVSVEEMI